VLVVPIGGGPTVGGSAAAYLVRSVAPRLVVPMHYRTDAVNFLEPPDAFLAALGAQVERLESSEATVEELLGTVPLAGAFCAGEIGPVGGRNFLHGFTASVAVFER